MSKGKDRPTREDAEQLGDRLRKMEERRQREWREAAEFKPGDLTPEEEHFVKQEGLNALTYIPRSTLQKHDEVFRTARRERPKTDLRQQLTDRFDGYGYGMFLFLILGVSALIVAAHGWPIGVFCCLLMIAVLELSYHLSTRR
ncbi:MAG TPA: hypothetical protein VN948_02705 [Terriglobales bacterium]|nr:hypothetical protein [Terriglobales bacterium]